MGVREQGLRRATAVTGVLAVAAVVGTAAVGATAYAAQHTDSDAAAGSPSAGGGTTTGSAPESVSGQHTDAPAVPQQQLTVTRGHGAGHATSGGS